MGGISIWQLIIIAVIVVLLFGTKKLRNMGSDLGSAVKGFKNAVTDDKAKKGEDSASTDSLVDKPTDAVAEQHKVAKTEKDQA